MKESSPCDWPSTVRYALEQGWCKLPEPSENGNATARQITRAANRASGLTATGKPRKTVARPELHGLTGAEYIREYQRLRRAK